MPERNDDLFHRLRRAGVRKPVAKTLSELTADAGKKAANAGHSAIAELRAVADEIEKRLPVLKSKAEAVVETTAETISQSAPTPTPRRRASPSPSSGRPRKTPAARASAGAKATAAKASSGAKATAAKASAAKPSTARSSAAKPSAAKASTTKSSAAKPSAAKPSAAKPSGARTSAAKPSAANTPTARRRPAAARSASASPAPRGENKAKILAALQSGPQTASEVSQSTGIATTTVSAALTRLNKAGEVTKATRGYALPS